MDFGKIYNESRRVLLNGRELRYNGGVGVPVRADDQVALFPPGR